MDDNVRELVLIAIEQHRCLAGEFGENDFHDSELKRVVELNGGKLKSLDGAFELADNVPTFSMWEVGPLSQEDKNRMLEIFKGGN